MNVVPIHTLANVSFKWYFCYRPDPQIVPPIPPRLLMQHFESAPIPAIISILIRPTQPRDNAFASDDTYVN